jgi:hypothetical protein
MIEKKTVIGGVEISYMRKPARYDTKHLVVIFSGFSGNGKPAYNYHNTLSDCPAEVVWILDYFFGGESYYLCAKGQFNIEPIVYGFISSILQELKLEAADCTVLGSSKGGSAAMYYGFKYNFGTIIASVPQFHIGSYVEQDWPYALKHMTSGLSESGVRDIQAKLDYMIAEAIKDSHPKKNVYLVSSLADVQYETEIANNVKKLRKFDNFNLIMANSQMIKQHNQVSRHTIAITMSIVNLSAMGMSPRFSDGEIKYRELSPPEKPSYRPHVKLKKFKTSEGRYYPEGISIIRGVSCENYSDINMKLILKNDEHTLSIGIAKDNKADLSRELFDGDLVNYDKGWFCTIKHAGLPIDELPIGEWSAHIEILSQGFVRQAPLISDKEILSTGEGSINRLVFRANAKGSSFTVVAI